MPSLPSDQGGVMTPLSQSLSWAAAHGMALQSAKLAQIPGRGLGVVATGVVNKGDVVLRVPHSLLLTANDEDVRRIGQTNALAPTYLLSL